MRIGQGRENTKKVLQENEDIRLEIEEKVMANAQQIDNSMTEGDETEAAAPAEETPAPEAPAEEAAPAPKKSKAKKSVVVDADDDFEEFSLDEIGE